MKEFINNLGVIIILLGVVILCIYGFGGMQNQNAYLGTSFVLMIVGLASHIWINKRA